MTAGYKRVIGATLLLVCGASVARAQQPAPTLHEYFEAPTARDLEPRRARSGARTQTREPAGPPSLSPEPKREELVLGESGPMATDPLPAPQGPLDPGAAQANKLDDKTDRVDQLDYFPTFDPSVIPYKRVVAQNHVILTPDGDWAMALEPGQPTRVMLTPAPRAEGEDSFWGTFVLRGEQAGRPIPIPSVAPSQRVLRVEVEPQVPVTIWRDAADNLSLQISHAGPVRVNMLIAVPRFYFDGELDPAVTWGQLDGLGAIKLPPRAQLLAQQALKRIGVDRGQAPAEVATKLIRYFRDFEGTPLEGQGAGADLYLTLVELQRGVCRHRSMAFVITALALGIPTRYVYNEAHAFVEIQWPGQGWRRVDLGGNADEVLMRAGQRAERVHDGGSQDPFPKPPAYTKELARMAAMQQPKPGDTKGAQAGGPGAQEIQGEQTLDPRSAAELPEELFSRGVADAATNDVAAVDPEDQRAATTVRLVAGPQSALRGGALTLSGSLVGDNGPLAGRKIALYLAPSSSAQVSPAQMIRLGEATTNRAGRWSASVELPKQMAVGRWTVRAIYAGEEDQRPAMSP
jgi:transglutaminase-like putative cysteine protease